MCFSVWGLGVYLVYPLLHEVQQHLDDLHVLPVVLGQPAPHGRVDQHVQTRHRHVAQEVDRVAETAQTRSEGVAVDTEYTSA